MYFIVIQIFWKWAYCNMRNKKICTIKTQKMFICAEFIKMFSEEITFAVNNYTNWFIKILKWFTSYKYLLLKTHSIYMFLTKVACHARAVKHSSSGVSDQQSVGSSPGLNYFVLKQDTLIIISSYFGWDIRPFM